MDRFKALLAGAKRSRTVWFGTAVAILGYAQASRLDVETMLDAMNLAWIKPFVWPAIGVTVILLRAATTQPLAQR
jgi:hypothetical protein